MSLNHPQELIREEDELVFSLPTIYVELQKALSDPDKTFRDLGDIIGFDPALSARLLKIVNSPFYGFPSKIDTISHAISIIGMDQLTDLALATLVIYQFEGIPNNMFNMEKFWWHSVACGVAARSIADIRNEKNAERFYLAGILHDIGRELLKAWKLPPRLVEAVGCHHQPQTVKEFPVDAAIIHTADYIVHVLKVGSDAEFSDPQLDPKSWEIIGFSPDDFELMKDNMKLQYEIIVSLFFGDSR